MSENRPPQEVAAYAYASAAKSQELFDVIKQKVISQGDILEDQYGGGYWTLDPDQPGEQIPRKHRETFMLEYREPASDGPYIYDHRTDLQQPSIIASFQYTNERYAVDPKTHARPREHKQVYVTLDEEGEWSVEGQVWVDLAYDGGDLAGLPAETQQAVMGAIEKANKKAVEYFAHYAMFASKADLNFTNLSNQELDELIDFLRGATDKQYSELSQDS